MKIAFLGLGAMGTRMAERLIMADHHVALWNRSPRRIPGALIAATPRAAAEGASLVLSMLTDMPASGAVWLDADHGAMYGMAKGTTAVECSTLTPAWTRGMKAHFDGVGVHFLEAPVVGTTPHAEAGTLKLLIGGAPSSEVLAVLAVLGEPVPVGVVGQAMALKLAVNALFATQVAALGEALALMKTEQINAGRGLDLLESMPVFSPVLTGVAALMRARDDAPRFPVRLVEKDLSYAASTRELPLTNAVRARYQAAIEAGLGDRNLHTVTSLV